MTSTRGLRHSLHSAITLSMAVRYDIRKSTKGWDVIDLTTGQPAKVNDVEQVALDLADADDLADLLNHLETKRQASATH